MKISIARKIITVRFEMLSKGKRTRENLEGLIQSYQPPEDILALDTDDKTTIYNKIYSIYYTEILNNEDEIIIEQGITLNDPKYHHSWDTSNIKTYYWDHLNNFLSSELLRKHGDITSAKIIKSLDKETEIILSNMEDPRRGDFTSKGLVVGYVQSGKTQNFTGLIAKSADAGYRLIVVLAGMYNSLRQQTQVRIDRELTGYNTLNLDETFVTWTSGDKCYIPLTSAGSVSDGNKGEFGVSHMSFNDIFSRSGPPVIAVIKKNMSVLNKFFAWVNNGENEVMQNVPLLMIDDEADQASVDTAKDEDHDPKAINGGIRNILKKFKKHSYIGYTATPFANVLIGRDKIHPELDNDLYPRNFIHTLPEPENYFGTNIIFAEDYSQSFLEVVPNTDKNTIIESGDITRMLDKSILTYLISILIRQFRGDSDKPMSMLIHVDHRKIGHKKCLEIVEERISVILTLLKVNTFKKKKLIKLIEDIYNEFVVKSVEIQRNLKLNHKLPDFDYILSEIEQLINEIKIYKLNMDSDDELDYISNPSLKVIAIGGNQLSRGLTLEGLMTTYFLRDSKQYDTLLQMGRWFGYRPGFEDLIRIFTPQIIIDSFTHLALVEDELRQNFEAYKDQKVTPAEIAPVIRDHSRLNVTSKNKMRAASRIRYYGKTIEQTIWFPLDDHLKLKKNLNAAELLLNEAIKISNSKPKQSSYLIKHVPHYLITNFLKSYHKPDKKYIDKKGIDIDDILRYIYKHDLDYWNVCIAGSGNKDMRDIDFGTLSNIKPFARSRKISRKPGAYDIGVLSSKNHLRIDLEDDAKDSYTTRVHPLIVLYRIDRFSEKGISKRREALFEGLVVPDFDPVGFAIVFPAGKPQEGEYDYIGQIFE